MKTFLTLVRVYRDKIPLIIIILLLPFVWTVAFVPFWVSSVGLVMILPACWIFLVHVLPPPGAPRRRADESYISNNQIKDMREASSGLHNLLVRWSQVSHNTRGGLREIQQEVDAVILQTLGAVINISDNFRAIVNKTNSQMEHAMRLLQTTRNTDKSEEVEVEKSLPEYINAYEDMLDTVTNKLIYFSDTALGIVDQQKDARASSKLMDDLLDEIANMARQIRLLTLNSTVSVGNVEADQRAFAEMSEKIRDISQNADELNRRIRQHLGGIKEVMKTTNSSMQTLANEAKDAAHRAKVDVTHLTSGMMMKSLQVSETLESINAIGSEIRQDINNIIISMQFQDITQQKLERLKHPVLNELAQALRSISDETTILNRKLDTGVIDIPGMTGKPFRVAASNIKKPGESPEATPTKAESKDGKPSSPESDDRVELF